MNQYTTETHFTRNFAIGMVLGFAIMMLVGILINNVPFGVATGPALGSGLGFALHSILNKKNEKTMPAAKVKTLIAILFLGLALLALTLIFLIN